MSKGKKFIIFLVLLVGILFRLWITRDNNFLFTMDNARDAIDVREIVVLHKLRLIGPTSGIEGLYDGPAWYYLLAVPFFFSGGNPYASVLLMILFWAVGGYYLLKIVSNFGALSMILVGGLWVSSNYVVLANLYAFNPNPLLLLMPVFIYWMERYLKDGGVISSLITWLMSGLFLNFEMAFGIFMAPVILFIILITGKLKLLKTRNFWIGAVVFVLLLLPQVIFNFKHNSLLVDSILNYSHQRGVTLNIWTRLTSLWSIYSSVLTAVMMGMNWLAVFSGLSVLFASVLLIKRRNDDLVKINLALLLVPFLGYLLIHINVMPWHLGGAMVSIIILLAYSISNIKEIVPNLKYLAGGFCLIIFILTIANLNLPSNVLTPPVSSDSSSLQNELKTIDFVYSKANGKNFKVYTYLPSVIDYPSQYLFWWYGQKKYGYLPEDYAYEPNKPPYISNKEEFNNGNKPKDSNLVFLIEQQNDPRLFDLWKNDFTNLKFLEKDNLGPYVVEVRSQQ